MRKIIYFLPLAVMLAAVFLLSSQPRDQQSIIPLLSRLFPPDWLATQLPDVHVRYGPIYVEARTSPYHFLDFIFRKSAHIVLYTLTGLALYAASFSLPLRLRRHRPWFRWFIVLAGIGVIAALDEWNQSRIPLRSGQITDVWLDLAGGMIGTAAVVGLVRFFVSTRRNRGVIRTIPSRNRKPKG